MKENVVNILILVSGIGIGILSSKQYFEKKYFEISENEIESVRQAYYRDKKKTDNGKNDENAVGDFSDENPTLNPASNLEETLMSEITGQYNYGSAFGYDEDKTSDDETSDFEQPHLPYDDVETQFDRYQIMNQNTSDFYSDRDTVITPMSFYTNDGMFVDSDDSEFHPALPKKIIDELSEKDIDELVNSKGHVYVFGKTSNTCFDITIIHGSYEEMILGRDHAGEEEE